MLSLLIAAFIMGGLGSLHCVGMCGPLALSLPAVGNTHLAKFNGTFLYNIGRVFTYSTLGAGLGALGNSFAILGFQQGLSIVMGVIIIVVLLFPKKPWVSNSDHFTQRVFSNLRSPLSRLFRQQNYKSMFYIGLLNGLLPCGLVYMAAAGAIATGSVIKGSLFMAAFGFGTFPLMWSLSFFGNFINLQARTKIRKAYPYLMFLMACLLIVRGLNPVAKSPGKHNTKNEKITNCYNINSNINATK